MKNVRWGIDLGGTKIEIVACTFTKRSVPNAEAPSTDIRLSNAILPEVILRERIPTPVSHDYKEILEAIKNLCLSSQQKLNIKIDAIGLGHPGSVNPKTQRMRNANATTLNNQFFYQDLRKLFNSIGINRTSFDNDANCFALAEHVLGTGKDYPSCFGVILGTGVGGGLCIEGRTVVGHGKLAGEWGHLSFWDQGSKCYCGKRGCIETLISGPALERLYQNLTGSNLRMNLIAQAGTETDSQQVSKQMVLNRLLYWLSRGLSHVINIVDPDCIIIGGGLSGITQIYTELPKLMNPWVFTEDFNTPIIQASLGDSAGVFGAALLVENYN